MAVSGKKQVLLWSLLTLLAFSVAAGIFLPQICSTALVRSFFLSAANDSIYGKVRVDEFQFSWGGPQKIHGLNISDPESVDIISAKELALELSFFDLLMRRFENVKGLQIKDAFVDIKVNSEGQSNLDRTFTARGSSLKPVGKAAATMKIEQSEGSFGFTKNGFIEFFLKGMASSESNSGTFLIDALVPAYEQFQGVKGSRPLAMSPHFNVNIHDFPLEIIDFFTFFKTGKNLVQELLGPKLSIEVGVAADSPSQSYLRIASKKLRGEFKMGAAYAGVTLVKPAVLTYTLTPKALNILAPELPLELEADAVIEATVSSLLIPYQALRDSSWVSKALFQANANLGKARLGVLKSAAVLDMKNLDVTLARAREGAIKATIKGEAFEPNGAEASLDMQWKGDKIDSLWHNLSQQWRLNFQATRLPTALFDPSEVLVGMVGPEISTKAEGFFEMGQGRITLNFDSEHLSVPNMKVVLADDNAVVSPMTVVFDLPSSEVDGYLSDRLKVGAAVPIKIELKELTIPLGSGGNRFLGPVEMTAESVAPVFITAGEHEIVMDKIQVALNGKSLAAAECSASCEIRTAGGKALGILLAAGQLAIEDPSLFSIADMRLQFSGDAGEFLVKARVVNNRFELVAPAKIAAVVPRSFWKLVRLPYADFIDSSARVTLAVAPFSTIGEGPWQASGTLQIDALSLLYGSQKIMVKEMESPWLYDGKEGKVKLSLSGRTFFEGIPNAEGAFKGKFCLPLHGDGAFPLLKGSFHLVNFPSAIAEMLTGKSALAELIGKTFNAEFTGETGTDTKEGSLRLDFKGEGCAANAMLSIGDHVKLKGAQASVKIKLDQKRFSALTSLLSLSKDIALTEESHVEIVFDKFDVPLSNQDRLLPLQQAVVKGSFEAKPFAIKHNNGESVKMGLFSAAFNGNPLGKEVRFSLQGSGDSNRLSLEGVAENLLTDQGKLDREGLTLKIQGEIKEWNPMLLAALFVPGLPKAGDKLDAVIGRPLNADLNVDIKQMTGSVEVSIEGPNGNLSLDAAVSKGILHLQKAAVAEVVAKPALGKELLKDLVPLFKGLQSSDAPIKITVSQKHFSLPITNWDTKELQVGSATVEMGKMRFSNSGQLKTLLGLLGAKGSKELSIWITPLYLEINDGKLSLQRVDMLVNNSYHLACWGTIDIVKDKVNLVVGVSGDSLAFAFNLPALKGAMMFQVPIKGTIDNPSIDKTRIAARISSLITQVESPKTNVVSAFLEIAAGSIGEGKIPPPTTVPLPWEVEKESGKEDASAKKKKGEDVIQKEAKALLKKLFK